MTAYINAIAVFAAGIVSAGFAYFLNSLSQRRNSRIAIVKEISTEASITLKLLFTLLRKNKNRLNASQRKQKAVIDEILSISEEIAGLRINMLNLEGIHFSSIDSPLTIEQNVIGAFQRFSNAIGKTLELGDQETTTISARQLTKSYSALIVATHEWTLIPQHHEWLRYCFPTVSEKIRMQYLVTLCAFYINLSYLLLLLLKA